MRPRPASSLLFLLSASASSRALRVKQCRTEAIRRACHRRLVRVLSSLCRRTERSTVSDWTRDSILPQDRVLHCRKYWTRRLAHRRHSHGRHRLPLRPLPTLRPHATGPAVRTGPKGRFLRRRRRRCRRRTSPCHFSAPSPCASEGLRAQSLRPLLGALQRPCSCMDPAGGLGTRPGPRPPRRCQC